MKKAEKKTKKGGGEGEVEGGREEELGATAVKKKVADKKKVAEKKAEEKEEEKNKRKGGRKGEVEVREEEEEEEEEELVPKVPIHFKTKKIMKKEDSLDDILKCFWHGSIYGKRDGWPRETILYYQLRLEYDDMEKTMQLLSLHSPTWHKILNDFGKLHAEEILLGQLLRSRPFNTPIANCKLKCVELDIVLSYSPCNSKEHACARKLVSFKRFVETNLGAEVILSIKIANFYNLWKTDNIKGLCLLINSGVHLSVFSGDKDWIKFYNDVTPENDLENQIISNNYTNERQQREEVDVMILQRLKNIAPYFEETEMIPPKFEDLYFCAVPAHFTQSEVRNLTAEYYRRQMENLKNA